MIFSTTCSKFCKIGQIVFKSTEINESSQEKNAAIKPILAAGKMHSHESSYCLRAIGKEITDQKH